MALLLAGYAGAVAQNAETPESVARQYFDAIQKSDWKTSASLMHPEELARFKEVFGPLMASPKGAEAAKELLGLENADQFNKLTGQQVFEHFLTSFLGRDEGMADMMSSMKSTIIGSIPEGKDVAHVLYRMKVTADEGEVEQIEVTSLRRYNDGWRMMLEKKVEGLAQMISTMVNAPDVETYDETDETIEYHEEE